MDVLIIFGGLAEHETSQASAFFDVVKQFKDRESNIDPPQAISMLCDTHVNCFTYYYWLKDNMVKSSLRNQAETSFFSVQV